jgi:hypothetical protein
MFPTIGDQPPPWESYIPAKVLRLPDELAQVDALLDDPAFFAPFAWLAAAEYRGQAVPGFCGSAGGWAQVGYTSRAT